MTERRHAIVCGAAGGIGQAVTRALVTAGFGVTGLDVASAPETAGCVLHRVDLADGDACEEAVTAAASLAGRLDALVHAAGVTSDAVAWKLAPGEWDRVVTVNLTSAFRACRAAVPAMRRTGGGGIVLVSSINGERGKFGQTAYAASKAGLHGLAKSLARETGRFGIRVNVVAPGLIRTAMTRDLPEDTVRQAVAESCLGRPGEPEDVAGAIAFFLSDAARHVTGQVLRVDGGQLT